MSKPSRYGAASVKAMDARLARVEGQVRGIRRMLEADQSCEQIALQLTAARKALDRAFYEMVSCMIRAEAEESPAARRRHADQVAKILARFA